MVTKDEVNNAKAEWVAAHKHYYNADAFDVADARAVDEAWDKYIKLKREYDNGK